MSDSLQSRGLHSPWNSPGQKTAVVAILQGIVPTQEWNPGLLHCRQVLYQLSHWDDKLRICAYWNYLCVLKIHFLPLAAFKISLSLFFFFFVFSCLIMIIYTCRILWYFPCLRFILLLESMDWCSSSVLENSKCLFLQILLLPYSLSPDFLEI